jgi:hypothetical protein
MVEKRKLSDLPKRGPDPGAAYGNFLYLLAEMEFAIDRGNIPWSEKTAQDAQRRLGKLLIEIGPASTPPTIPSGDMGSETLLRGERATGFPSASDGPRHAPRPKLGKRLP